MATVRIDISQFISKRVVRSEGNDKLCYLTTHCDANLLYDAYYSSRKFIRTSSCMKYR